MDIEKVKQLIKLIEGSSLAEIDLKDGNNRVRLRRDSQQAAQPPVATAQPVTQEMPEALLPQMHSSNSGTVITAPMEGVFTARHPRVRPFWWT